MTPNPIHKVLSTFQKNRVRALLIGGQACVLYGAAEFSRDTDFAVLVDTENLKRLRAALRELQAEPVFFPPLRAAHLRRGHACHFRCLVSEAQGMRVDVMAKLRGCDEFPALWKRRVEMELEPGLRVPVIGLRDLVRCKKTQRDKDWLMLRRLVDNDIHVYRARPSPDQVRWWLLECRSVENLVGLVQRFPAVATRLVNRRPLLSVAVRGDEPALAAALREEEQPERERDLAYWKLLRRALERMRRR